jgi:hypothetical protein
VVFKKYNPGCPCCEIVDCTIFEDNFDRADGLPGSDWEVGSGTWAIGSNQLACTAAGNILSVETHPSSVGYSYLSVNVKGPDGSRLRVIVQYTDEDSYHYAELKVGTDAYLRVVRYTLAGGHEQVGNYRSVTAAADTYHTLKVCDLNSASLEAIIQVTVTVSGADIGLTRTITPFTGRQVGLSSDSSSAYFNDFLFSWHDQGGTNVKLDIPCPTCSPQESCEYCLGGVSPQWMKVVFSGHSSAYCDCDSMNGTYFLQFDAEETTGCVWRNGAGTYPFLTVYTNQIAINAGPFTCGPEDDSFQVWYTIYPEDEYIDCTNLSEELPFDEDLNRPVVRNELGNYVTACNMGVATATVV